MIDYGATDVLNHMGIPYDVVEGLIIAGDTVLDALAKLNPVLYAIQISIRIAEEYALNEQFNKLTDELTHVTPDMLNIPVLDDINVLNSVELSKILHLDILTDAVADIPDEFEALFVANEKMNSLVANAEDEFKTFWDTRLQYIDDKVYEYLKDIAKNPIFYGIIFGMIGMAVMLRGKCAKYLKRIGRQIATKVKEFVKNNFNKLKEAFNKVLTRIRQKRNTLKTRLNKSANTSKQILKQITKAEEKLLKKEAKSNFKKFAKDVAKRIADKLKSFKVRSGMKAIFRRLNSQFFKKMIKFAIRSLDEMFSFLKHFLERMIRIIPHLKQLIASLIILVQLGVETTLILLFLAPILGILYGYVLLIQYFENKY